MAIKINLIYLFGFLMPFLITRLLKPFGYGFLIYDAKNDEGLFDDLWANKFIGITSTAKYESMVHKNGTPDIIIGPYNQDWREQIDKIF